MREAQPTNVPFSLVDQGSVSGALNVGAEDFRAGDCRRSRTPHAGKRSAESINFEISGKLFFKLFSRTVAATCPPAPVASDPADIWA